MKSSGFPFWRGSPAQTGRRRLLGAERKEGSYKNELEEKSGPVMLKGKTRGMGNGGRKSTERTDGDLTDAFRDDHTGDPGDLSGCVSVCVLH